MLLLVIVAADRSVCGVGVVLWNTQGECVNYGLLRGHKNAVLDLAWSHDGAYDIDIKLSLSLSLAHVLTDSII